MRICGERESAGDSYFKLTIQVEVSLFARPNAAWDIGAMATASAGKSVSPRLRGQDQQVYCLEDVQRAASLGIRSVLLANEGALWVAGVLPREMQFKISVMMASANPASIHLMERLGADTFNIPTDLTLAQIAERTLEFEKGEPVYIPSFQMTTTYPLPRRR